MKTRIVEHKDLVGRVWCREYLRGNKPHRNNGPAIIDYHQDGSIKWELWLFNGLIHRTNGPAEIKYLYGDIKEKEIWYRRGQIHRDDRPAMIWYYGTGEILEEIWYRKGKIHRVDGPARICRNKDGQIARSYWHINNYELTIPGNSLQSFLYWLFQTYEIPPQRLVNEIKKKTNNMDFAQLREIVLSAEKLAE